MNDAATMTIDAQQEFTQLLERHRKIVFTVANTYARHAEDRADLAQEIAVQLWRAYPKYDANRSFSTWMYRIALNVGISFLRHHGPRQRQTVSLDDSLHGPVDDGADHETDQLVHLLCRIIDGLEPLNRALLFLYLEERSQREIADILGISESNVATKINRLKQRIRNDINPTGQ